MLKRICKNVTLPGVEGCLVVFILDKEITFCIFHQGVAGLSG